MITTLVLGVELMSAPVHDEADVVGPLIDLLEALRQHLAADAREPLPLQSKMGQ